MPLDPADIVVVTSSDVATRLSTQAYNRLFAKNGGNTPVTEFVDAMVGDANSLIAGWTYAAFPQGFTRPGGVLDAAIVMFAVKVVCYLAASNHPSASADASTAYRPGYDDAERYFRRLSTDAFARPVTSDAGRSQPQASASGFTDTSGNPTNPYVLQADADQFTGF